MRRLRKFLSHLRFDKYYPNGQPIFNHNEDLREYLKKLAKYQKLTLTNR
jgi:hypothetical protein